jgi:hypothetical protein
LAPYERASGIDGITVTSIEQPVYFDVAINEVVVER